MSIESDGIRRILIMLSGKWKLEILIALNERPHRYGELSRAIPRISRQVLMVQLRELVTDGLVSREESPGCVEYSITPKGRSIESIYTAARVWYEENLLQA